MALWQAIRLLHSLLDKVKVVECDMEPDERACMARLSLLAAQALRILVDMNAPTLPEPPAPCGTIQGLTCPEGLTCVDDPSDTCRGAPCAADCAGLCVEVVPASDNVAACGGFLGTPCPEGYRCADDPSDSCNPQCNGADCPGLCIPDSEYKVVVQYQAGNRAQVQATNTQVQVDTSTEPPRLTLPVGTPPAGTPVVTFAAPTAFTIQSKDQFEYEQKKADAELLLRNGLYQGAIHRLGEGGTYGTLLYGGDTVFTPPVEYRETPPVTWGFPWSATPYSFQLEYRDVYSGWSGCGSPHFTGPLPPDYAIYQPPLLYRPPSPPAGPIPIPYPNMARESAPGGTYGTLFFENLLLFEPPLHYWYGGTYGTFPPASNGGGLYEPELEYAYGGTYGTFRPGESSMYCSQVEYKGLWDTRPLGCFSGRSCLYGATTNLFTSVQAPYQLVRPQP